jgi:hypothetical protein
VAVGVFSVLVCLCHVLHTVTRRAEKYLRSVVGAAVPNPLRKDTPTLYPLPSTAGMLGSRTIAPTTGGTGDHEGSGHSTYHSTIETYMYRNNCHRRLGLPHRCVPLVQVDLYGLQEILAVRAVAGSMPGAAGAHAPVSIPSGVSPLTYMAMFNKPTLLAPTTTTHAAAALDIYAVMRLAPAKGAHSAHSASSAQPTSQFTAPNRSAAPSGTTTPVIRSAPAGALTNKNCPVGSVVTAVHKADARRTPLEQSDPTAGTIGGAGPGATVLPNAWYKQHQPAIARAVEYNWRDQALFRFALPEGQHYTHLPANAPTLTIHPYPETVVGADTNGSKGEASAAIKGAAKPGALPSTVLHVPASYFETPSVLVIAVYERTFFADTLLGELELDLSPLNTKRYV